MAWAEDTATSTTTLYIADTPSGTSEVVTESTTDTEGHWAWDVTTATLTLDGFNGGCIESTGALNIVLKGTNTITMPSTLNAGSGAYNTGGIKASAAIEISGDSDTERDSLTVTQTATSKGGDGDNYGIGIRAGGKLTVTDCDLTINMNSNCDALKTCSAHNYGIYAGSNAYITGAATLAIEINGAYEARGVVGTLHAKTSGNIEITVKSARSTTPKTSIEGASAIVASGSGKIDIDAAGGYASHDYFEVFKDAGEITFKGMLCIGKDRMKKNLKTSGSNLSLNISDNKKIVRLCESGGELDTACGFLYQEITGITGGYKAYYLTNTNNNPIKIGNLRRYTREYG